jgi:SAM-dependent methyltransferase
MDELFNTIYKRRFAEDEPLDAFLFHAEEQLEGVSLADKNVLEVGCGSGSFSLYMALCGRAKKVVALDPAEGRGMDAEAFEKLETVSQKHATPNLRTFKSSIYDCRLPEQYFDLIIANSALHHAIRPFGYLFKNQQAQKAALSTFRLLHSLLKDGGSIVLREMSRINVWRFLPYKWKMRHVDWGGHATLHEWRWIIKKAGFCDVHHSFLTPFFLRKWPSFLIRNACANFFFSSHFYVYATKRRRS